MDLTLTGDIAKQIISLTKKDSRLAVALARQFLSTVEPLAMARYLLTHEVAAGLLAQRISKNPEATLRQLQGLSQRGGKPRGGRAAKRAGGRRKRHRLTGDEIQRIKGDVRSYLGKHPWSNRKQIGAAVAFPSLAAYNRIMTEMRRDGIIQAQGEKSKTVYAVKGQNGRSAGRRAKKAARAATE